MTMTPKEQFDHEIWWVLQQLEYRRIYKRAGEKVIAYKIQARPPGWPGSSYTLSVGVQEMILLKLEEWKAIKIVDKRVNRVTYGRDFIYWLEFLEPRFSSIHQEYKQRFGKDELIDKHRLKIKSIDLNLIGHTLEFVDINNIRSAIPFSRKRNGTMDINTKQFKILDLLWKSRHVVRGGKTVKGEAADYITLKNLQTYSGCKAEGATRKQIDRLQGKFDYKKLPINIEKNMDNFQLVVQIT